MSKTQSPSYSQFACIGSGFSAIGLGATLKRWYGITDVRFFEKQDNLGGTWFINQYPGCACDVPSILYSFSFSKNPNWTEPLPSQDELWNYLNDVVDEYDLRPKMTFGSNVESCRWIEASKRWQLVIRDVSSGDVFTHESQFLFAGCGILVEPKMPELPGVESFKGEIVHSARWRQDIDLKDKNVAVFGNGCTATQIVPAIAKDTAKLTQIIRSKHWLVPPADVPNTDVMRWLFRNVPGAMAFMRFLVYLVSEEAYQGVPLTKAGDKFRQAWQESVTKYIRSKAPKKYHDLLIPEFPIGCKRRVFDTGYLDSLNQDHVELTDQGVDEVLPDGLRTKDGKFVPADVMVMATGFNTERFLPGIDVEGREGKISEHWNKMGGPGAYNSTAVSGFPNFFLLLGPNSATGHTSTIMAIENSINFALRMIKPVLDGQAIECEVKAEAELAQVQETQEALKSTVWATGCQSWYVRSGTNEQQWNGLTYPHSQSQFWKQCMFPKTQDFNYTPAPGASKKRSGVLRTLIRITALASSFILLFAFASRLLRRDASTAGSMIGSLRESLKGMRHGLPPN